MPLKNDLLIAKIEKLSNAAHKLIAWADVAEVAKSLGITNAPAIEPPAYWQGFADACDLIIRQLKEQE